MTGVQTCALPICRGLSAHTECSTTRSFIPSVHMVFVALGLQHAHNYYDKKACLGEVDGSHPNGQCHDRLLITAALDIACRKFNYCVKNFLSGCLKFLLRPFLYHYAISYLESSPYTRKIIIFFKLLFSQCCFTLILHTRKRNRFVVRSFVSIPIKEAKLNFDTNFACENSAKIELTSNTFVLF